MLENRQWITSTELGAKVRSSATIDWTRQESARAGITVAGQRILNKCCYQPDFRDAAAQIVLLQAGSLCKKVVA